MIGIPLTKRKLIMGRESTIPKQYKDEIAKELLEINIGREIILSCALIVMVSMLLTVAVLSLDVPEESLYVSISSYKLHILLLLVSMGFLLFISSSRKADNKGTVIQRSAHVILNSTVLMLCAMIAVNNELAGQRPFSYITAMFCIGSVVLMPTVERLRIFFISWLVYQAGLFIFLKDPITIIQNFIFVTSLMALSLLISSINYSAYIHDFLNRKTIEENNKELSRLYKITEENLMKRTEELNHTIELEKVRTAFFANISHELRTPLNIVYSAEQLLERTLRSMPLQTGQKEINQYMHIMKQNCYRLIRIISNLIDITKIDAGYLEINPKRCDIIKVIEDICLSAADLINDKGIFLTFDTEIEERGMLCDPEKIERIILNLLSNAVKFTPRGGQIFVNVYDRGDRIVINVKDTGIGIPLGMEARIFERFVQVDKTSTRDREGSGIGLALAKSLVEMHGGRIAAQSSPGKGSEFIIELPYIQTGNEHSCHEYEFADFSLSMEKVSIEFSDIYD